MKILILGGTRFVGKKLTKNLLKAGHILEIVSRTIPDQQTDNPKYFNADRKDEASLRTVLSGKKFDCVIDMINFSSKDSHVFDLLIKSKALSTSHYVCISTAYTYLPKGGNSLDESEFNPAIYPLKIIDRPEVSYDEGKKLSEAYIAQKMPEMKTTFIRFPIIFGSDDYTSRFFYFLNELLEGNELIIHDNKKEMSYIDSDEAASFIQWVTENQKAGIFNAACEESITEFDYAIYQNEVSGLPIRIKAGNEKHDQHSPMFTATGLTLDCSTAKKQGYKFSALKERIKIHTLKYIENKNKS